MDTGTLSLARIIRGLLITGAVGALPLRGALADTPPDQTTPPPTDRAAQLGKIEVTGTRIKRVDVEAARPITIITKQQIKATGLTSVGDVLQQLPSAGAAVNSQFNNGNSGRSNADLRNLGSNRLLVLLDGKRVISGLAGDVDLNTIPLAIIDHIEVLQDGASAVYGSDAISGVVNLITVKNYDGAEANAHIGKFDAHGDGGGFDGESQQYDFTVGTVRDKGGVVLNVSYVNDSPVYAGDRSISKEPVIGSGESAGSFFTPNGFFLMETPNGVCPGKATLASDGTCDMTLIDSPKPGRAGSPQGPSLGNFRNFDFNNDPFNYAPANFLATPSERIGFYVQDHYDLMDNLSFESQVLFNSRRSSQQLAPDTLSLGGFGQAKANGNPVGISGKNPYNPFGKDLVTSSSAPCLTAGSCDVLFLFGRRLSEAGNRVFNQHVDNFQFNGGFRGYFQLLGGEWDWDAGYAYGENYETDLSGGVVNTDHLQQELGAPGSAPCAGASAACTPINLFGGDGAVTPAMLNYILFEQHNVVEQSLRNYTANTAGQLVTLPAGALNMALGTEYLETDGFSHPDALVTEGNTASSLIPPTEGRERTLAEYVEFDIPLVADAPFMKKVGLDLADRWSQFRWQGGDAGTNNQAAHSANTSTGNASLRWEATDELLLRASWAQGFRIPSISDLFLADSDDFEFLNDPCISTPKAAHCGTGAKEVFGDLVHTTIGGNTLLTPEHAISQTVGFVYSPGWLQGFDVSADYYKIKLENAIGQIPPQLVLNGCYDGGLAADCQLIHRSGGDHSATAPGEISNIQNLTTNAGGIKTEGVDVAIRYKFPSTSAGDFKLGMDWDFTRQYVATLAFDTGLSSQELSGTTTDSAGGFGIAGTGQVTGGVPKQRANINLSWAYGAWSASWNVEYISALVDDCTDGALIVNPASRCPLNINFPFANGAVDGNHIGATFYPDVQAGYHLDSLDADFSFGIRNLFDKEPPIAMAAFANSYLPTFYRTPGRFLFGSVGVKF
ncbi:MAG TPA: TonB-dependent receptor [Gammaproteobacteria bacterium]|jgi:outer membrane receptor protein involved in Fe transport|nr:TonB-dependent receptor [Gammaproteobacteria bacterium]